MRSVLPFAHGGVLVYFFLAAAPGQHVAYLRPGGPLLRCSNRRRRLTLEPVRARLQPQTVSSFVNLVLRVQVYRRS